MLSERRVHFSALTPKLSAAEILSVTRDPWCNHDFHDREPAIGRFGDISRLIVKSICLIFMKIHESCARPRTRRFNRIVSYVK